MNIVKSIVLLATVFFAVACGSKEDDTGTTGTTGGDDTAMTGT